jgi:hypothetical protein
LLLAAAVTLGADGASAQARTTLRDRIEQEKARDAVRDADRFAVLDGVVTDTLLRPLGSADVSVIGTGARVVTGENGRFRMLQVPPGQYLLVVRRIGYAPTSGIIDVPERDTLRLAYTLVRSNNLLDTVRVRGSRITMRMLDFERRREIMPYVERLRDVLDWPLVYVSHAVDEVARIAREVVVLEGGSVRVHRIDMERRLFTLSAQPIASWSIARRDGVAPHAAPSARRMKEAASASAVESTEVR